MTGALLCLVTAGAGFLFEDFRDTSAVKLLGDAQVNERAVRLTPAKHNKAGAVWFGRKQPVAAGFETEFTFRFTKRGGLGGGADGLAFVIQNKGLGEIAGVGGSAGFLAGNGGFDLNAQGIPESIAVFFDTYQNEGDPSNNYVGVFNNGRLGEMRWPPPRLATSAPRLRHVDLKDGRPHRARIVYERPLLSLFLDGEMVLKAPVDLRPVAGADGSAWVGFTAATGGGWANHELLSWRFQGEVVASDLYDVESKISYHLADCMEGRNLCTPERASVEEQSPGEWRMMLPAHLPWPASVPVPSGRAQIVEARGTVCYGPNGSAGCADGSAAVRQREGEGKVWFTAARDGVDGQGFIDLRVRVAR